jgi:drug/metabolite transporter (DMT)-like permease
MFAALATVLFWSVSTIISTRASRLVGGIVANRARLVLATVGLALAAWLHGTLHAGSASTIFLISGLVGLGIGDIGLFLAYERLGSRLPALIAHTLAAPIAIALEWVMLGTRIGAGEAAFVAVTLAGVALALTPDHRTGIPRGRFWIGIGCAVVAAAATSVSAVLSRSGYHRALDAGTAMHWLDATLWRSIGGVAWMLAIWPFMRAYRTLSQRPGSGQVQQAMAIDWRRGWPYIVGIAACGPGLGLVFYQLALSRCPSGLVQAVVALVPVAVIPLAWWLEGDRPSWRGIVGGMLAVGGVVGIALSR